MNTHAMPAQVAQPVWTKHLALGVARLSRWFADCLAGAPHAHHAPNAPTLQLRPACPEDIPAMQAFVDGLSVADRRLRFHGAVARCSPALARLLVQCDGVRQVTWLAWLPGTGNGTGDTLVGEARFVIDADNPGRAELAIAVAGAHQGLGVADALLRRLLACARQAGVRELFGEVLEDNLRMRAFMRRHHFELDRAGVPAECLRLVRELTAGGVRSG